MGRMHALLLASRGAKVIVSDLGTDLTGNGRSSTPAQDVVETIRAAGGDAVAYTEDLTTEHGARGAVRAAIDTFKRIDVIVHNAGFTLGERGFESETLDRLDKQLAVNTRAAFCLLREAWPSMCAQGHGRIVLVASAALHGIAGSIPYSIAKSSYVGLVRALASEGAPQGIKVNGLEPSAATRMSASMAESDFRTWFLKNLPLEPVSSVVACLAHDDCPVSGEFIISTGDRVARTVLVDTEGQRRAELTPEVVRDLLPAVLADERYLYPKDGSEAVQLMTRVLGYEGGIGKLAGAGQEAAENIGSTMENRSGTRI